MRPVSAETSRKRPHGEGTKWRAKKDTWSSNPEAFRLNSPSAACVRVCVCAFIGLCVCVCVYHA